MFFVLIIIPGMPRKGLFVDHGDQYVRFRINFPM